MSWKKGQCPVCNSEADYNSDYGRLVTFYVCPVCGRFELSPFGNLDYNQLASYLAHNGFKGTHFEYRYHTGLDQETCDKYKKEFEQGNTTHGHPVHMDAEMIENWYPKTFSERVDYILLYINAHTSHIGQQITLRQQELFGVLFVDQHEITYPPEYPGTPKHEPRDEDACENEAKYMLDYLVKCSYIEYTDGPSTEDFVDLRLTPDGYARVDVLLKNSSNGRSVLVAMKFGDDTLKLREAIRSGITRAGYIAIFIDEVQHNDLITPELLKQIRDSKFVVVDLTHQNNGAYFEEGYAMGLGKPVIQLCQTGQKLHFDIAQINTIMWETEADIPDRLYNRIKATID